MSEKDSFWPFESKARFDVSALTKNDLQDSIRETFFMDQLQLKESPAMTATEVNARFQLMQRLLGPTLGRIQSDFLDPLITRTFNILYRYGMIPDVPEQLAQTEMDIQYLGPMAKAQRFEASQKLDQLMANVGAVSEIYPEARHIIDPIEFMREKADALGTPANVLNSNAKIKSKLAEEAKARKEAQEAELTEKQGKAISSIGQGMRGMNEGEATQAS